MHNYNLKQHNYDIYVIGFNCPFDYNYEFSGSCYKLFSDTNTMQGALDVCGQDNAYLVAIETEEEYQHLDLNLLTTGK